MTEEKKEIIIRVPNYMQGALQEQILYVKKKYKYANHEKPRLLSVDTWSNRYSVMLYTQTTEINSCLCGCSTTRKGQNNELYCTSCFQEVDYDLVRVKRPVKKEHKQ